MTIRTFLYTGLTLMLTCSAASAQKLSLPDYNRFTRADAIKLNEAVRKALKPVYPLLADYIVDRFQLRNRTGIGIDIGGGPGDLVLELCKRTPGFYWINTDVNTFSNEELYRRALKQDCAHQAGALFADAKYLPFRDDYADIIISRGSLQFWGNLKQGFAEIYRVLKPGGWAMIGRGFPENMPLHVAKQVRKNQGGRMPKYNPKELAEKLNRVMTQLKIKEFNVIRPRTDQKEVNYGVWVIFTKTPRLRSSYSQTSTDAR